MAMSFMSLARGHSWTVGSPLAFWQSLSAVPLQSEDFGIFFSFFFFHFKTVAVLTHDPVHVKELLQRSTYNIFSRFLF